MKRSEFEAMISSLDGADWTKDARTELGGKILGGRKTTVLGVADSIEKLAAIASVKGCNRVAPGPIVGVKQKEKDLAGASASSHVEKMVKLLQAINDGIE